MKIQHLESFISRKNDSLDALREDLLQTYVILMNSLLCLKPNERWIVVDKVAKPTTDSRISATTLKKANDNSTSVTRVALKLEDIQREYQDRVEEKLLAVSRNISFAGF